MICPDYIRSALSRACNSCGPLSLACLLLLCPAASYSRQATPPRPPRPAQAPVAAPAQAPGVPAQAPVAPAPPARTPVPRRPPMQVVVPREVVTVVHRLSGWKLLAWLATSGPPAVVLEELPSLSDTHTNIVAGYVYGDGRSVVARLPQAEVELEAFDAPQTPPAFFAEAGSQFKPEPEYMLVTSAGSHVEAKLVGLDSSTGLALLQADQPLLPGAPAGEEGDTDDPTVGQRVRLYAPIPAEAPPAPVAKAAPPMPPPGSYISLSIDQKEGRLTRLIRTPSGRLSSVAVNASVSPAWVGAVAANELGEVVGIISQSREGETRLLPVAAVHEACERVLKLRGTVPQPWLGARGDAVAQAPLQFWVDKGWTPAAARPLIARREGVLLTSVAQGTPAALAGLQAGDLITNVGPRAVRSPEDLSMTLKEAGVGSVVDVTVLRATTPAPLKLSVELKGAKNPALATAEAEWRAASARFNTLRVEVGELQEELAGLNGYAASPEMKARAATVRARLSDLLPKLRSDWELFKAAEERAADASLFSFGSAPVIVRTQPLKRDEGVVTRRLKGYGLHALGLSARSAARFGAHGGLLVVAVQPESPAAASGLMPGDVIETVNGSLLWRFKLRQMTSFPDSFMAVFGLVRGGKRLSVHFPPAPTPEPERR